MKLSDKQELYLNTVKEIFPELDLRSAFTIYSGEYPTSAEINLSNQSKAFKNKYKFSNRFIHYTSIDSLFNILTSQELRLYNCNNLNDKQELKYAVKELSIDMSEEDQEQFRRSFFIFSATEVYSDEELEDYNLWRLYGNDGNGVAIEFEILNPNDDWDNVFYGKVNYDKQDGLYNDMNLFIQSHQKFNSEHNLFTNIPSIIPAIALHFKNEIWKIENEIRLLAYCPFDKYTFKINAFDGGNPILNESVKHVLNKNSKASSYVSLPLNIEKEKREYLKTVKDDKKVAYLLSCIPHLKIKRIILGYNNHSDTMFDLYTLISGFYSVELNYQIDIRHSKYYSK